MVKLLHTNVALHAVGSSGWSVDEAGAAKFDFEEVSFDGQDEVMLKAC